MKNLLFYLVFIPFMVYGQVSDNFESGNLNMWMQSLTGRWGIDSVTPLSGKYSLWHSYDNPEAGSDQIAFRLINLKPSAGNIYWSFLVRHGCDPSSSNNWAVFLLADNSAGEMKPGANINGFAVGVNLTGYDDTLRLWKIKNGAISTLITARFNWQNDIGTVKYAGIEVKRTPAGEWTIFVKSSDGKQYGPFCGTDIEMFRAEWCGIYYRYTSTRDRLLWLDNMLVEGAFIADIEPPVIVSCKPEGRNNLVLELSEEVTPDFSDKSNFLLNGFSIPVNDAFKTGPATFVLKFNNEFTNKKINTLKISNICDLYSNCSVSLEMEFTPVWAEPGDIIISEIMADPTPVVSLPATEYLEITSMIEQPVSIKGWSLSTDAQKTFFPECIIRKGEPVILCSSVDTALFLKFGKTIGLKSFPALTNEGRLLVIYDSDGNMIHWVEYSSAWHDDRLKADGGWSLEMIDTEYPFYSEGNWKSSVSPLGGTPGKSNSVSAKNIDPVFEGLVNVFPADSIHLNVLFSEPVKNIEDYLKGIIINGEPVNSVAPSGLLRKAFIITTGKVLKRSKIYQLSVPSDITDFAGNRILVSSFLFGLPEPVLKGDVVFNELLFNPLPGDADYIEFCNVSDKIIDASELSVASRNFSDKSVSSLSRLSEISRCILPGSYYVVTTGRSAIIARYFSSVKENIFNVPGLPSMPDDEGSLGLYNRSLEIIDATSYSEKQHFALLTSVEGVSLEKIMPEALSSYNANWHSASESSGWGTPGAKNSVFTGKQANGGVVELSSSRLTPDNDGEEDVLVISFSFPGMGNVVNVIIFDENGAEIKRLATNYFIGSEGMVVWDGTAADGSVVRRGIYIIYVSSFDDTGKTQKWKKVCSVLR